MQLIAGGSRWSSMKSDEFDEFIIAQKPHKLTSMSFSMSLLWLTGAHAFACAWLALFGAKKRQVLFFLKYCNETCLLFSMAMSTEQCVHVHMYRCSSRPVSYYTQVKKSFLCWNVQKFTQIYATWSTLLCVKCTLYSAEIATWKVKDYAMAAVNLYFW